MFTNYFKTALRNIRRHKVYAIVNIIGLSIGMACMILILRWVQYELSFDRYHENADRIYRLVTDMDLGKMRGRYAVSNYIAGKTLARDYPEVEKSVRFQKVPFKLLFQYDDIQFYEDNICLADSTVFDIFTFPLIQGDPHNALNSAFSIVITEDLAQKYFGDNDPIGRIIRANNDVDLTVTGIMQNVPRNSHFLFDALVSFEILRHIHENYQKEIEEDWMDHDNYTYLLLRKAYDYRDLEKKFPAFIEKHMGTTLEAIGGKVEYFLQPLTQIHLKSKLEFDTNNTDIVYVLAFSMIAIFVLCIACINFMNLSTGRSVSRAKEVGVRKAQGAQRSNLIHQFLCEAFLWSCLSFAGSLGLVEITLPFFHWLSGIDLSSISIFRPWFILGCLGLILFVAFVAGIYPAVYLSGFQTIQVLTGRLKTGPAGSPFRNTLVVGQFTISIGLIIVSAIIFAQIHYMKHERLGFNKNRIVVLRMIGDSFEKSIQTIKTELSSCSGVIDVTASSHVPGGFSGWHAFVPQGYRLDQTQVMASISIDPDFIPMMGIQIVDGRNFSDDIIEDQAESILINEEAAKRFGWKDPVGKTIRNLLNETNKTVIGVVSNFHLRSLHHHLMPLYIDYNPSNLGYVSIKIKPDELSKTLHFLRQKWVEITPAQTLDYFFLAEAFDQQYRDDEKLGIILSNFSTLAILIACLGLFGLASFTVEKRTKEIGIRKALGASVFSIIVLLLKEFTKLILLANVIAWPIAFFTMNRWLQNYAYRIEIGLSAFVLAGLIVLVIALLTAGYQAIKAARANPVDALRYE
ncbi:MAG: ABC transporter permease [Desulfobacterales bacterium]|jgi:putative ABC transport system permease protein